MSVYFYRPVVGWWGVGWRNHCREVRGGVPYHHNYNHHNYNYNDNHYNDNHYNHHNDNHPRTRMSWILCMAELCGFVDWRVVVEIGSDRDTGWRGVHPHRMLWG
jgi:hypothetical protein